MVVLGSNSPRRKDLLNSIGIKIDFIAGANIDETPLKGEVPREYVKRMAFEKSIALEKNNKDYLLTADTIVVRGRRIIGKPATRDQARKFLQLLSGCRHKVITSVCLAVNGDRSFRTVETIVKFKCLATEEIEQYLQTNEWTDKAGGYGIQGVASVFIPFISGSYTNVVGLPLTETAALLRGAGYKLALNA